MTTKKPTKKTRPLPNKLSALLRLAVKDARAVEKMKGYRLDMRHWHAPTSARCHVCMAGAVMVKELRVPRNQDLYPSNFGQPIERKLDAINDMRLGFFRDAFVRINGRAAPAILGGIGSEIYEQYTATGGQFTRAPWSAYLAVADKLEEAGL